MGPSKQLNEPLSMIIFQIKKNNIDKQPIKNNKYSGPLTYNNFDTCSTTYMNSLLWFTLKQVTTIVAGIDNIINSCNHLQTVSF